MARAPRGFGEGQATFRADLSELDRLFEAYGHRCAFTGEDLKALIKADPLDALLRLPGPEAPQYLDPDLLIPASAEISDAYRRGQLALGRDFSFLIDWSRFNHALAARLNRDGKLRLPASSDFRPNPMALEDHREAFAAGAFLRS